MRDPVRIPTSDLIVERKAIKQHLILNGNFDPYNRQELTEQDLEELPELKSKINLWIKEKTEQNITKISVDKIDSDHLKNIYQDEKNDSKDDQGFLPKFEE